jgi:hypothetical protein
VSQRTVLGADAAHAWRRHLRRVGSAVVVVAVWIDLLTLAVWLAAQAF